MTVIPPLKHVMGDKMSGSPTGTPHQVTKIFPFQSYFDSAFEANTPNSGSALLEQPANAAIIQSTLQDRNQQEAYAIGLAPWSEAPIAVRFQSKEAGGLSSTIILRPGQIVTAIGLAQGEKFRSFRGIQWGLPFGWLGGGLVTLFFFQNPDSVPQWQYGAKEVCFHKFQTEIIESSATPPTPQRTNWPTRFPWQKAYRGDGTDSINQVGTPNFSVNPTKTLIRLNLAAPANPVPCRLVFWGTDTLDQLADGVDVDETIATYWEFDWPSNPLGFAAQRPMLVLPDEFSKLAANAWGITIEALAASELLGETVNIARFGLI